MPSIAVCNEKGGPGKTTSAVDLTYWLTRQKHKVTVINADADADALRVNQSWQTEALQLI